MNSQMVQVGLQFFAVVMVIGGIAAIAATVAWVQIEVELAKRSKLRGGERRKVERTRWNNRNIWHNSA